ncbi:MAG: beta-N-acetylhexosaminidase [Candidatus Eremiobacteraeota bacterium]|jgi:beta-N-acetylhexosaminidase|nr:beta-N-acetylhexosaminidase [Candidatus Eremiobacteraeota bacterium]
MTHTDDLGALARGVIGVGFTGATADTAPLEALRAFAPGALILFARNAVAAGELRELVGALRDTASPAPLIMVDQEGGRVERIRHGVAALPSAMAVGATGDIGLAEKLGTLVGRDLARLGINVDLAPVADLSLQPRSVVVATRAYGDDPERVGAFAGAFAHGLERAGVAATVKHFPGHGSTAEDSHVALPRVTADAATLRTRDLVPFAHAIADHAASIVITAHVVIEAFDPDRPATISHKVLTGLLRDELGYDGIIATDCLEMDAIAGGVGTVRGAVEALAAGADLLLISHRLDLAQEAAEAIVAAVRDGEIPLARLRDANERVRALRERLAQPSALTEPVDDAWPLDAARRAVTVLRGDAHLRAGKPVTVISFEGTVVDKAASSGRRASAEETPSLSSALRRRGWKSEVMRVPLEPAADDIDLLLEHIPALGDREFVIVTRDAHLYPGQFDAVTRILTLAPDALIVSARSPYDALLWPQAKRVICIYGGQIVSLEGCADVISGRAEVCGSLPVRLTTNGAVH